ncbi:MAG: hypothetical protein Ct9H90mP30_7210 [Actinomycetota bacterium]|nr:MAG: hypothetical protein Ct9H90mP30_7210 [Actinomycetota bacterium]
MDLFFDSNQTAFRDEIRHGVNENKPNDRWAPMDTQLGFEQHRTWERTFLKQGGQFRIGQKIWWRDCSLIEWFFI